MVGVEESLLAHSRSMAKVAAGGHLRGREYSANLWNATLGGCRRAPRSTNPRPAAAKGTVAVPWRRWAPGSSMVAGRDVSPLGVLCDPRICWAQA